MSENSLDPDNKRKYAARAKGWEEKEKSYRKSAGEDSEHLSEKVVGNKSFVDVTEEWYSNAMPDSHKVIDLREYTVDGTTYKVDGKHVVLKYSQREKQIAEIISKKLGGEICMMPKVLFPQGIKTPDYLINGERYDLKSPTGIGKEVFRGMVKGKKKQANNFVFDISNCPLEMDEIERQIEGIYKSNRTDFVQTLVLVKGDDILKIYKKK